MAKTCITEKTARRQRWIEEGLLELMQHAPLEEITVTELCRHLALSRRSFYRYFRDVEDVLDSLLHHTFEDFAISGQTVGPEELQRNFEFWIRRRELLDALARSGLTSRLVDFTLHYAGSGIPREALNADIQDLDIQREIRLFSVAGQVALVTAWHAEGFRRTTEEMARIAYHLLTVPILRP